MHLVIDIGNTLCKLALFDGQNLVEKKRVKPKVLLSVTEALLINNKIEKCIVSSVVQHNQQLEKLLASCKVVLNFDYTAKTPVKNLYETPETLGLDRLANAVALQSIYPDSSALAIDCGTCIKYDFVDTKGNYFGGGISPGLTMRFQALNHFTAKLPICAPNTTVDLIGTNTPNSIQSGVQFGLEKEIEGVINLYKKQYSDLKVVLTGGDAKHFAKALKNTIFARPNLTLEGLNEVLIFNE